MSDLMPELSAALVAALAELTDITKTKDAKIETKTGGSFSYRYAELGDVLAMTRKVLAAHGLAAVQPVVTETAGNVSVYTEIIHVSGQSKTFGPLTFAAGSEPRTTGSAITYARRYSLMAALGLATEDDDAAQASQPAPRATQRRPAGSRAPSAPLPAEVSVPLHDPGDVYRDMVAAPEAVKAQLKALAAQRGKKLSEKAIYDDLAWCAEIDAVILASQR